MHRPRLLVRLRIGQQASSLILREKGDRKTHALEPYLTIRPKYIRPGSAAACSADGVPSPTAYFLLSRHALLKSFITTPASSSPQGKNLSMNYSVPELQQSPYSATVQPTSTLHFSQSAFARQAVTAFTSCYLPMFSDNVVTVFLRVALAAVFVYSVFSSNLQIPHRGRAPLDHVRLMSSSISKAG
ncbi:hypothetical protein NDU88_005429 [Pleurodeles waltl]|uniref:Uncharacterized protein n=1 Tax=Pleurodeles waltl TaxID=8319 RepID=A0AAV7MW94_PLEWA|nr:hypothetical protein NDU88_005429 [Pleurodeles waltl]